MNLTSGQRAFIMLGWVAIVLTLTFLGIAKMHPDESTREEMWLYVPIPIPAWVAIGVLAALYLWVDEGEKREREVKNKVRRELRERGELKDYETPHITKREMRRLLAENYDARSLPTGGGSVSGGRAPAPSPRRRPTLTVVTEIAGIISMIVALLAFWFTP